MKNYYLRDTIPYYKDRVGKYSYGNPTVIDWYDGATLTIGDYTSIATGVTILLSGEHRKESISNYPFSCSDDFNSKLNEKTRTKYTAEYIRTKGDVFIGNDVWIGWNALILSGVKIGDGSVIGAGSVVSRDVEPYTIVAGNPATIIRKRFTDDISERLLKIKWWEKKEDIIKKYYHLLQNELTQESLNILEQI